IPPRWPPSWRSVTRGRSAGNAGTYLRTSSSTSRRPCWYRRATAAAVRDFETLPIRNCVRGVTRAWRRTSANPQLSDQTSFPAAATATESPGEAKARFILATSGRTTLIWARYAGAATSSRQALVLRGADASLVLAYSDPRTAPDTTSAGKTATATFLDTLIPRDTRYRSCERQLARTARVCSRCRAASNRTTPAATATLRLSAGPGIGICTSSSAVSTQALPTP